MTDAWGLTAGNSITNAGTLPTVAAGSSVYASPYALAKIGSQAYLFCVNADDTTLEAYEVTNTNPLAFTLLDSETFTINGAGNYASNAITVGSTIYVMVGNWDWGVDVAFTGKIYTFDGEAFAGPLTNLPGSNPGAFVGTDGTEIYVTDVSDPNSPPSNASVWRYNAGTWDALSAPSGNALANWSVCGVAQIGSECVFFGTSENEAGSGLRPSAFKVSSTTAVSLNYGDEYAATGSNPETYYVSGALSFNSLGYCVYHDWDGTPATDYVWQVDPATGAWVAVESFEQSGSAEDTKCGALFSYEGSIYTPLKQDASAGVAVYKSVGTTVTDPWVEVSTDADDDALGLTGVVF